MQYFWGILFLSQSGKKAFHITCKKKYRRKSQEEMSETTDDMLLKKLCTMARSL